MNRADRRSLLAKLSAFADKKIPLRSAVAVLGLLFLAGAVCAGSWPSWLAKTAVTVTGLVLAVAIAVTAARINPTAED